MKAIRLDDNSALAHSATGHVKLVYDRDWEGSIKSHKRAIDLDPALMDARFGLANTLMALGRHSEAISTMQVIDELDPFNALAQEVFGRVLYRARRFDEAERRYKRAIELDKSAYGTYGRLSDLYIEMGRYAEARANIDKSEVLYGGGGRKHNKTRRALLYAHTEKRAEAMRIAGELQGTSRLEKVPLVDVAMVWAKLGNKDKAFNLLSQAIEQRQLVIFLKVDPPFDTLHSDPRWKELMRKLNLQEDSPDK